MPDTKMGKVKSAKLKELQKSSGMSQDAFARAIGIGPSTLGNIYAGKEISHGKISQIAAHSGLAVIDLVELDSSRIIPNDAAFLAGLNWGYFIDNNRRGAGSHEYFEETFVLVHNVAESKRRGSLVLTGKCHGPFRDEYTITAERLNQYHYSLTAIAAIDREYACFHGSFSARFDNALVGTWAGIDFVSSPTVYRMFLTTDRQSLPELLKLESKADIDIALSATVLHNQQPID